MAGEFAGLRVAVLAGGPDAEREVSLSSASAVAEALGESGRFGEVLYVEIDRLSGAELAGIECDLFFPVLHGPWGEGGPLQEILEKDGRPFVGSGSEAAGLAMDKMRCKEMAAELGIGVAESYEIESFDDDVKRIAGSVVVKPVDDGSSVNIFICHTDDTYCRALCDLQRQYQDVSEKFPRYMVERFVPGREITVSIVGDEVSSIIEIIPNSGFYDYEAKYGRDDTTYVVNPELPDRVRLCLCESSLRLYRGIGARDLARVDFRFDEERGDGRGGGCYFLEINTIPGFTAHSLLPMGAKSEQGWDMGELCVRLVEFVYERAR